MTYNAINRDLFDDNARQRYLDAVTAGMNLGDAAAHTPIHPNIPPRHARTDSAFRDALTRAKAHGKKVRVEDLPHDEYRYNCHNCRCDLCRAAATQGRADRRAAAAETDTADPPQLPGQVHEIRAVASSLPSLLLARAS